jgi:beta-glucosidase-like glycosyl hydrolase
MEKSRVDGTEWKRHNFDATVTAQDLADSYLPAFQSCVEEGRVSGLMCSYNALNGVPTCADPWLLETVARDAWQFDGYVTSDCDADSDVFVSHNYTRTADEAVGQILHAGTDLDCGGFIEENALQSLASKTITIADIETRITNLFMVRLRLGHFDPEGPLQQISPAEHICSTEGRA